ncbi:hypothetical protein SAMD00024442_136_1 [Candidatus Symbiothrix dinenymphae]|nr:hypothetical protein SAMD00024442_136_1 [Candidatus Symbiothrix dinenymphae]
MLLCCITSRAAEEWQTPDVRSFSLGDLHALSDAMHNPAQMAIAGKREAGLSVLNRFQMSELNTGTLYAKLPNQWLDVGAKVSVFGYSDYQLTQVQAGFAKQIFADFAIGVNGTVANENSILEEASTTFFTTGIGIYWHFNNQFDWALLVENVLNTLPDNPIKIFGGCNYKPIEFASIALEGSYDKTNHFNLSIGLEYEILKQFILRSGVTTDTGTPSFGIGYRWSRWQADIGFALHPELGTNSMIGIRTTF